MNFENKLNDVIFKLKLSIKIMFGRKKMQPRIIMADIFTPFWALFIVDALLLVTLPISLYYYKYGLNWDNNLIFILILLFISIPYVLYIFGNTFSHIRFKSFLRENKEFIEDKFSKNIRMSLYDAYRLHLNPEAKYTIPPEDLPNLSFDAGTIPYIIFEELNKMPREDKVAAFELFKKGYKDILEFVFRFNFHLSILMIIIYTFLLSKII